MARALLVLTVLAALGGLAFLLVAEPETGEVDTLTRSAPEVEAAPERQALDGASRLAPTSEEIDASTGRTEGRSAPPAYVPPDAPTADHRLLVEVRSEGTRAPLVGWDVFVSEVGAKEVDTTRAAVLDVDGQATLGELPGKGPWQVYVQPSLDAADAPRTRSTRPQAIGATWATRDDDLRPKRLTARTGPQILVTCPLPKGLPPEQVVVELHAQGSALSSQLGGLGGTARAGESRRASAAAHAPAITNGVRGEGGFVLVRSVDGRWQTSATFEEHVENDATIEVRAPFGEAGRIRLELMGAPEGTLQGYGPAALTSVLRQADDGTDTLVSLGQRTVVPLDGMRVEVRGLAAGPVWVEAGAEALGFRFGPLSTQATWKNPSESPLLMRPIDTGSEER